MPVQRNAVARRAARSAERIPSAVAAMPCASDSSERRVALRRTAQAGTAERAGTTDRSALLESAQLDGAGMLRSFVDIGIPLARPAFAVSII